MKFTGVLFACMLAVLSCSTVFADDTCLTVAQAKLGLKKGKAQKLCAECTALGKTLGPKCKACIKKATTLAKAETCAATHTKPTPAVTKGSTRHLTKAAEPHKPKSPKPPTVASSPKAVSSPHSTLPKPPKKIGAPVAPTCSVLVQQNLHVPKYVGDKLCSACGIHNQTACKTCVKTATTKEAAKACPAQTGSS